MNDNASPLRCLGCLGAILIDLFCWTAIIIVGGWLVVHVLWPIIR